MQFILNPIYIGLNNLLQNTKVNKDANWEVYVHNIVQRPWLPYHNYANCRWISTDTTQLSHHSDSYKEIKMM